MPIPAHSRSVGRSGAPRYFHLLWDEDLDDLREVLIAVRDRRREVVDEWYALYLLHFGDQRSLSQAEFREIFEPALLRHKNDLLRKDFDGYTRHILKLGEELADRKVPLQEIIASLHLFEEAAQAVFPSDPPPTTEVYTKFDKLSHIRIILLVDAYSRSQWAVANTRIHALELEAKLLPPQERSHFHGLVGKSRPMLELYARIEASGRSRSTVLVVGESGTGKELVARAIHECGPTPDAPFIALNCAALPKDLIESELFGYKRGSFSGANADYLGLFRAADSGTLFLDEVTEMNPEPQSKLLRAIQERRVRPIGATQEMPVNVRVVASTNRDPRAAIGDGHMRQDLYYRLQGSVLNIPPLRDRPEDRPLLVQHFIELFNERRSRLTRVEGIDDDAMVAIEAHPWPGNVRELSNSIESAFIFGTRPTIGLGDLPAEITGANSFGHEAAPSREAAPASMGTFANAEREIIERALEMMNGNKVRAAQMLKISRKRLYAKIEKYGLAP